jgi:serine/threonine protein kinase
MIAVPGRALNIAPFRVDRSPSQIPFMTDANISAIGKYRIIELVGEGAMGVVYRAQDSVLGRTVAIKVMNESIARQEDLRKRFLHEAQACASLQHPNVVCIYDLGEQEGHLFIAMEFVDGVDLERLIELGEPLSLQARLDIVIDVLTGLAFAHKRGIVHRDIKPANIRVGEDGRAKIMDFGVAHLASSSMTRTGAFLGTPSYMAPEQITEGKATPAADIFAVGAILYQLLAQMKPFDAPTLQNLFFKIITEKPRPISELMPALPPALDRIVQKAMAKDPSDRYTNALDMANELTVVRSKLSGPSYPASLSLSASVEHAIEQSRSVSRQRMQKAALVGVGAVAAVALIAIVGAQFSRSDSSDRPVADTAALVVSPKSLQPRAIEPVSTAQAPVPATPSPPAAQRSVRQDRSGPPARDTRAASTAKTVSKPVQPVAPPVSAPIVAAPVLSQNTRQDATPSTSNVVTTRPVPPPPTQETGPPPAPPTPSATDLAPAVESFARAIESRDIGAMRREFPGLTSEQLRRFEQFFNGARSINATFRIANVEGSGTMADARLEGNYAFVTSDGVTERQPVNFVVTVRHDGRGWHLVSLR